MLFLPTNLTPDSISVQGSTPIKFSWTQNGDISSSFQIIIQKNSDSSTVHDSGVVTSSLSEYTLSSSVLTDGLDYKWKITLFSGTQSVTSDYVFIKANTNATVTITTFPNPITTQSYTFTATYAQTQGIGYSKYKVILYDNSNNIISDSGWIYSYTISYLLEGFVSGTTYQIEIIVPTQYGIIATTGKQSFTVNYTYPDSINSIQGTSLDSVGGIKLDWSSIIQVLGVVSGTSSYVTGKFNQGLYLNPSSSITYTQTVPAEFTLNFWVKLPTGFTGSIVSLGVNEFIVGYDGTRFYINYNGNYIIGNAVSLATNFFLIGIKYNEVIVKTDSYQEIVK